MKVLIFLYILIFIANIFTFRVFAKYEQFEDIGEFLFSMFLMFVPILNIGLLISALVVLFDNFEPNIDANYLAKKIFFVKDKK